MKIFRDIARCRPTFQKFHPDDGGGTHLWNVGLLHQDYMTLYPRRLWSSYSPPWEPEVLLESSPRRHTFLLTPWHTFLLETVMVTHLVRNYPPLMELQIHYRFYKSLATGQYPEPAQSSPQADCELLTVLYQVLKEWTCLSVYQLY
jgi:hypothetical protein